MLIGTPGPERVGEGRPTAQSSSVTAADVPRAISRGLKRVGARRCTWCRELGHQRKNCPLQPPPDPKLEARNKKQREQYAQLNGEKKAWRRADNRCRVYGLRAEDLSTLRAAQNDSCGICGSTLLFGTGTGWKSSHIDHDHETGLVRGLLCGRCNTTVGQIEKLVKQGLLDKATAWIDRGAK